METNLTQDDNGDNGWERADQIATAALVVSIIGTIIAALVSLWLNHKQQQLSIDLNHKQHLLSIKPHINIFEDDYEDKVGVRIRSCGLGPVNITKIKILPTDIAQKKSDLEILSVDQNSDSYDDLIKAMPPVPTSNGVRLVKWKDYAVDVPRQLGVGEDLFLVLLEGDPSNMDYSTFRDKVRSVLGKLTIVVKYEDVDGNSSSTLREGMEFFLRINDN